MKESIKAYSKQKSLVKKALSQAGYESIKISNGFYYFSGFAFKGGNIIYFSIPDVRHGFSFRNDDKLLIRTAKDYRDFTGGSNNYCQMDIESIQTLANRLTNTVVA